jgi:two-component system CheB/CheR fusion protein
MLREGLLVAVRGAIHRARKEETAVREEGLRVKSNGGYRDVDIEVLPVKGSLGKDKCLLVLFEERDSSAGARGAREAPLPPLVSVTAETSESNERQILRLNQELAATREYLQSVIEQQEAANEELQSANEEVQSANEELQSINEELETSKEEIQSSNEELATVNDELQNRNLELSQTNNDLVNLLSSVQMPIVMLGPNLRIRRFTPMAERLLNLIPADVGRPISDIKLNIDVIDLEKLLIEVIDTVSVREQEVRDKQNRWYLLRIRPYKTLENKIDGAVMVLVDVDSLKRSEETARRQAELLEQTHEPIIMWEFEGRVTYWNRGALETYGYTAEQATGRNLQDLLRTFPPPATFKQALEKHGRWSGEVTHTRRDGQQIVMESHMVLVQNAAGHHLVIETDRDVTERRNMERALRERADELTHADRAKNEFLAMLAHELRNPLAPLLTAAEVMRAPAPDASAMRYTREVIERQVKRMARMVDDLIDVSRVAQGKLTLQKRPIEAKRVLTSVIESALPYFEMRQQKLNANLTIDDVWVDADPLRLEQVFANLLDNASKFSPRGGQIWVSAEAGPVASGNPSWDRGLTVRVRDQGMGISSEAQKHVFELFVQVDTPLDRSEGGLGIGLSLVKSLVEMHGGGVSVHSEGPDRGAEFIVQLPTVQPGAVTAPEADRTTEPVTAVPPRRVLIVDDSTDAAQSLSMALELHGHRTRIAHDGEAALEIAMNFKPEVIMLDLGLPGMDGFEIARRLRARFGHNYLRLVALSGYSQDEYQANAEAAGFDEYLVKPVDLDAVNVVLRGLRGGADSG